MGDNFLLNKTTVFLCYFLCAATAQASTTPIRKLCYLQPKQSQPLYIFTSLDNSSQTAAIRKNKILEQHRLVFSNTDPNALFRKEPISVGDCFLVNLQELTSLDVYEELDQQSGRKVTRATFLPAVHYLHKDKSKQYGLLEQSILHQLTLAKDHHESRTNAIVNYTTSGQKDLFLIYITCPAERNSLCDLKIKENGAWLKDPETGNALNLKVLARSQRANSNPELSQRTVINSDTPQGIYYIWGAVIGGDNSAWSQLARIDLDAALPPINGQPYNINSYLLSQIVPDRALDDYWLNEWPLAYSLGRVFLRIAPGGLEVQSGNKKYNATEGCINTGDNQEKLLKIMVQAGIFAQQEVFAATQSTAKQWHLAQKLGKALVIIKDRD